MVKLVNIHDAVPESWNFDILDLLEVAAEDRRLDPGQVATVVPKLSWCDFVILWVHNSVRWNVL